MSRAKIKDALFESIFMSIEKEIQERKIIPFKTKGLVMKSWDDLGNDSPLEDMLQDIEDVISTAKIAYGLDIAFKMPKELYDELTRDMDKIKYTGYEKAETTGTIERNCFYCGSKMVFDHWLHKYNLEMINKNSFRNNRLHARRIWNNEMILIACCNCIAGVSREEFLQKMYIMFRGHVKRE